MICNQIFSYGNSRSGDKVKPQNAILHESTGYTNRFPSFCEKVFRHGGMYILNRTFSKALAFIVQYPYVFRDWSL